MITPKPDYPPPSDDLIRDEVEKASREMSVITAFRLIALRTNELVPTESIMRMPAKDFKRFNDDIIEAWRISPEALKPIAVFRYQQEWLIVDGHHRWRSAKIAKVPVVWVVQLKGRLEDPSYRQWLRVRTR